MSFSAQVKEELCRVPVNKKCCALAESYGALLYANCFSPARIRFITGSAAFAARLPKLFRRAFGTEFDILPAGDSGGRMSLSVTDGEKIRGIFNAFGADPGFHVSHHLNLPLVENDCDKAAFLRGAFLAGGSVSDPAGRYHLELCTAHAGVCRETQALLLEMGFEPRDTSRRGAWLNYFKKSAAMEDFLTTIGAPMSAMELMQATVEKDMTNAMNRLTNCDMANADKVTDAARAQLQAIRKLDAGPGLDTLPGPLQETALLRIANPACSLTDLAMLSDPPVSKSCVSHRLRKLMELAETL